MSAEALRQLGDEHNVHTFETSALTGQNVDSAFHCLIYQVLKPLLMVCDQIRVDLEAGDDRLKTAASASVTDPQQLERAYMNSRKMNRSNVEEARVNEMTYT